MSNSNDDIFDEIKRKATALNKTADKVSAEIESIDDKLNETGVGLEVWMNNPIHTEETIVYLDGGADSTEGEIRTYLGYDKIGDTWGVAVRVATYQIAPDEDSLDGRTEVLANERYTLLRNEDRATRIIAFPHVRGLLKHISGTLSGKEKFLRDAQKLSR